MKRFFPVATGLVFVAAGVAAMCNDKKGAELFGLPTKDKQALAYSRAAAARDLAIGCMLLAAPRHGRRLLLAGAIVSVCDFFNVLMSADEPPPLSLAIHGSGIIGLTLFALLTPGPDKK